MAKDYIEQNSGDTNAYRRRRFKEGLTDALKYAGAGPLSYANESKAGETLGKLAKGVLGPGLKEGLEEVVLQQTPETLYATKAGLKEGLEEMDARTQKAIDFNDAVYDTATYANEAGHWATGNEGRYQGGGVYKGPTYDIDGNETGNYEKNDNQNYRSAYEKVYRGGRRSKK